MYDLSITYQTSAGTAKQQSFLGPDHKNLSFFIMTIFSAETLCTPHIFSRVANCKMIKAVFFYVAAAAFSAAVACLLQKFYCL